jgi:hypothetical protein
MMPFLFQSAGYVWGQYVDWYALLRDDDRKHWALGVANRDLWLLFRVYHLPMTRTYYLVLQLSAAALVAGVCLALQRIGSRSRVVLTEVLAMGCCWMTLLGPATEAATYILLAPILAWTLLEIRSTECSAWWRGIAYASFGLFVVALLAGLFPNTSEVHALGLHPLGALLLWSVRGRLAWSRIFS